MPNEGDGGWRVALDGLLGAGEPEAVPVAALTPLALQFQIREPVPRTASRWNGPTSQAFRGGRGAVRLGVRPVVRTERGWARKGLTWSNLPHMRNRLELEPAQHGWFSQFVALHRAAVPLGVGGDPEWVLLDEFANPVLWRLLDQATALGIALTGVSARTTVALDRVAALRLDVTAGPVGMQVGPHLTVGGVPVPAVHAHPIGRHGVYVFDGAAPNRIALAELDHPLDDPQLAMLANPEPVDVPPADAAEFRRRLPRLRERMLVTSSDGSVKLPAIPAPTLVLTIDFLEPERIVLAWSWDARRGAPPAPRFAELVPADVVPAPAGDLPEVQELADDAAIDFIATALPQLTAITGVRVDRIGGVVETSALVGEPRLVVRTVPTERDDWFDLGVEVMIDGHVIPFLPLFKALAKGRRRLRLVDGTHLSLQHRSLARLAELIEESKDVAEWETGPLISRYQTALWHDFEDLADEADPAREWRRLLDDARRDSPVPIETPLGITAEMRPYQRAGLDWLAYLWRHRLGGVLADDMGLGKTLQCLALVQHAVDEGAAGPFLVVAPTSVVSNWSAEAARFAPGLVVRTRTATAPVAGTSVADIADGAHIVVTSYAILRLEPEAFAGVPWAGVVLDEAQFVKNPGSRAYECVRDLGVPFTLAVTGTPMENSLADLHAIMGLVAPGLFPSLRRFTEEYVRPIEQRRAGIAAGPGAGRAPEVTAELRASRIDRLRSRIRPFLLRRTKDLVAADLPPKQEQVLRVELSPAHREVYDLLLQRERQKLFGLLPDLDRHRFIVLRSLTLLRMLALDARLIGEEYDGVGSAKLDVLLDQLEDVLAEGHRALVFSQFTSYLALVGARLTAAGVPYVQLDGSTRDRDAVIGAFKTGEAPVFLVSLKAGGVGLNLTEADYVFLLDPWWNPASEAQAIDRTHRIGQDKRVMVYRLVAAGTIEEKVQALAARKAAVFDAVIDDDDLFGSVVTADDIRALLD